MFEMGTLLALEAQMFLLMLAGLLLKRTGIVGDTAKNTLTDVLIWVILPCSIINSFRIEFTAETLRRFAVVLGLSALMQAAAWAASRVLYRGVPAGREKVLRYGTLVSNASFLGLPVAGGVFGAEGLLYASVFVIPMRVVMWTAGIACFTGGASRRTAARKALTHPCIVAVYIGLVLMFTQLPLPDAINRTLTGAAGCMTTVSMLAIGMILAEVSLRGFFSRDMLWFTLVRLGLLPALALLLCRLLPVNPVVLGVTVLLTAMPIGSTAAMLAAKYGGDYVFAARCTVITTVLSLATLPLWCLAIG